MRRGLKPFSLLLVLGAALLAPLFLGCAAASVAVPDPAPLEAEAEEDEEESEEQGG